MRPLTVVMYHYVRPIEGFIWPKIKGLEFDKFKRQLDYLSRNYDFVTAEDVINSSKHMQPLSSKACWLTFDDGYKDHYRYVLPELLKRGIQGSFFPPAKPITERSMLDVNSVHHILASTSNLVELVEDLNLEIRNAGFGDDEIQKLWSEYAVASRYDSKEVIYVKKLLQYALPEHYRNLITSILFRKYVGLSQAEFGDELYMCVAEVKELVQAGMHVGSHGYRHLWLNKESKASQKSEIERSLTFLNTVGARTVDWIMCYPYGAYNEETIDLLKDSKCAIGITTEVAVADLSVHHPLKLPRLDTNDLPQ